MSVTCYMTCFSVFSRVVWCAPKPPSVTFALVQEVDAMVATPLADPEARYHAHTVYHVALAQRQRPVEALQAVSAARVGAATWLQQAGTPAEQAIARRSVGTSTCVIAWGCVWVGGGPGHAL